MACSGEVEYAIPPPNPDITHQHVLIFFIPGNPGLVEYYRHFLDIIRRQLTTRESKQNTGYYIHGANLAGFDVETESRQTPSKIQNLPLSLDEQVEDVYRRVECTVDRLRVRDGIEGELPVVLIGHSIGAYMVLQAANKWQTLAKRGPTKMRISAGICLFPTICELALSPTGRQVGPLTRIPAFALLVHTIARVLFYFAPLAILARLVGLITGMPLAGATITAQFLQSKHGVRQALHMAKDELSQLTHDQWSDDFWGVPAPEKASSTAFEKVAGDIVEPTRSQHTENTQGSSHTQLHFYWGSNDHWIAQDTRDRIIATRARTEGKLGDERKPIMEIDGHGIGHAFCLSELGNQVVAKKCAEWICGLQ